MLLLVPEMDSSQLQETFALSRDILGLGQSLAEISRCCVSQITSHSAWQETTDGGFTKIKPHDCTAQKSQLQFI